MELNRHEIMEKWEAKKGKVSVASIEDPSVKENMAVLLENQDTKNLNQELMLEADFTTTTPTSQATGQFQPISLALVRRTFPELFANKVVPVQAMSGPVGLAYALRFLYNGTPHEMAFQNVDVYSGFTGSISGTSGTADTGTGVALNVAEAWKLGTDMPQGKLEMSRVAIEAKTRKLGASYSLEAAQDIRAMHGVDIDREMINVLQYEVLAEIDRELVQKLKTVAVDTSKGGETATSFDVSASDGRWSQERYSNVANAIIKKANDIATSTRQGAGNFVIVSPRVATALQSAQPMFTANTANVNATNTMTNVGSINGVITVYRDSYATSDYALVGYKGPGTSNGGVIYSPYIMGLTSRAIGENSFSPRMGVMSRYALTDNLLGSGRYYRLINVSNLDTVMGL